MSFRGGSKWGQQTSWSWVALPLSEPIRQAVPRTLETPLQKSARSAHIPSGEHLPHLTYLRFMEEGKKLKKAGPPGPSPAPLPPQGLHSDREIAFPKASGKLDSGGDGVGGVRLLAFHHQTVALKVNVFRQIKAKCWCCTRQQGRGLVPSLGRQSGDIWQGLLELGQWG